MEQTPLLVPVTDDLVLDAGSWHMETSEGDMIRIVSPPTVPLIDQLIQHLEAQPKVYDQYSSNLAAVGLAALTVRWGSYFGVLADQTKPLWPLHRDPTVSRIGDWEMMRINIEATYALSRLIDLYRNETDRFWRLMHRAVRYLPVQRQRANRSARSSLRLYLAMASSDVRLQIRAAVSAEVIEDEMEHVRQAPSRIIANAIINGCWRNGLIEDIHAGYCDGGRPLRQARISRAEDRRLFAALSDNLTHAHWAIFSLVEGSARTDDWAEAALPFSILRRDFGGHVIASPKDWSLKETASEVQLAGMEPDVTPTR